MKIHIDVDETRTMTSIWLRGLHWKRGEVILPSDQIHCNPYLDEQTNGLSYASEHMKKSPFCYQITFNAEECERSELAMDAIQRM